MNVKEQTTLCIKLLFSREKGLYSFIAKLTGYCPRRIGLYRQALTHRSVDYHRRGPHANNERLEYLGDAVLNSVVADILFRRYPSASEGFMTETRSKIVSRTSLNHLAAATGLSRHIAALHHVTTHNCSMNGNALEAVVGAAYLDLGYHRCQKFITHLIDSHIDIDQIAVTSENHKSRLLEWAQKRHRICTFEITETTAVKGGDLFTATASIDGTVLGTGTGYSKREAHQHAALAALKSLDDKH